MYRVQTLNEITNQPMKTLVHGRGDTKLPNASTVQIATYFMLRFLPLISIILWIHMPVNMAVNMNKRSISEVVQSTHRLHQIKWLSRGRKRQLSRKLLVVLRISQRKVCIHALS